MPGPARLPSLLQVAGQEILSLDFAALTTDLHEWTTSPTVAVFSDSIESSLPSLPNPHLRESSSERCQRVLSAMRLQNEYSQQPVQQKAV